MKKVVLGRSGIAVSKIGLGTLTISPLQKNYSKKEFMPILHDVCNRGINFFDTAELYDNYSIIKEILLINKDAIVATKSYAYDAKTAETALNDYLAATGRDYVDIFLMHEQESYYTLKGHYEALEFYIKAKKMGKIRAVGISTHKIEAVKACIKFPEIEILHPLINYKGYGIIDGTLKEMEMAITKAKEVGIGIYAMKIFGGGHLLNERKQALDYILSAKFVDSFVVGMQSLEEVAFNVDYVSNGAISEKVENSTKIYNKVVSIESHCVLCGNCAKNCPQNAIQVTNKAVIIDKTICVLCGYCGKNCPQMAIKIF